MYIFFSFGSFVKLAEYLLAQQRYPSALKSPINILEIFPPIQRTDMFELSSGKDGWAH